MLYHQKINTFSNRGSAEINNAGNSIVGLDDSMNDITDLNVSNNEKHC